MTDLQKEELEQEQDDEEQTEAGEEGPHPGRVGGGGQRAGGQREAHPVQGGHDGGAGPGPLARTAQAELTRRAGPRPHLPRQGRLPPGQRH